MFEMPERGDDDDRDDHSGSASSASMMRLSVLSTAPRKYPVTQAEERSARRRRGASRASRRPGSRASRRSRARRRRDRPCRCRTSACSRVPGACSRCVAYGLFVKCEPKSAAQIQNSRITAPTTNVFDASSRRSVSRAVRAMSARPRRRNGTGDGREADRHVRHRAHPSEYLIRGFSSAYSRSAMIVATRYTTPIDEHARLEHREVLGLRGV